MDSMKNFNALDTALKAIVPNQMGESVYKILALILHFGNIQFRNNDDGNSELLSFSSMEIAANLACVDFKKLEDTFLKRRMFFKNAQDTTFL